MTAVSTRADDIQWKESGTKYEGNGVEDQWMKPHMIQEKGIKSSGEGNYC